MIKAPVTSKLELLLAKYGVDPAQHRELVSGLMNYVYDQREAAVDEVLGIKVETSEEAIRAYHLTDNGLREDNNA